MAKDIFGEVEPCPELELFELVDPADLEEAIRYYNQLVYYGVNEKDAIQIAAEEVVPKFSSLTDSEGLWPELPSS